MSNYFCDHIQLEGLLYDTKHELLAIAKFLIIYCRTATGKTVLSAP